MFAHLGRVRTFGLAAEMAFWVFLSLIPLAAVAGLVAARLALTHANATGPLLMTLPPATRELVRGEMGNVAAWNGGAVALPAVVMFFWLASSGVHAIFDALEIQTQSSRPWWKKRILALGACIALSTGIAAVTLLTTGLGWVRHLAENVSIAGEAAQSSVVARIGGIGFGAALAIGFNAGLFWVGVPEIARRRLPVWPGALLTTFLEVALGYGYSFYVGKAGDGGAYQGALAVIGVTLTALYLLSTAILVGAELNRYLGARRGVCVAGPRKETPSRLQHAPDGRQRTSEAAHPHPRRRRDDSRLGA